MHADVLVTGGGVAGLSAGLAAADEGAAVALVESAESTGGSALLSNGSLWTYPDLDEYLARCPGADRGLAELIVSGHRDSLAWLAGHGVPVTERGPSLYGARRSHRVSPAELIDGLTGRLRRSAAVRTGCRAGALSPAAEGFRATTDAGVDGVVEAGAVVVATGGVHADRETLRQAGLDRFVGLPLRNRLDAGDGVRLAMKNGAGLAGAPDGVYGHLVPVGLDREKATSPLAAQYQSVAGMLMAPDGSLIAGPGASDHELNGILAAAPARRGVLIFDSAARPPGIRGVVGGADWAGDRAAFAAEHGRNATSAAGLGELFDRISRWGYAAGADARATAAGLGPAPYTAIEVEPSVTHVDVGIRVDPSLQAHGVAGLFVAGADVGAGFGAGYGGGLSLALTTGIAAGRAAARLTRA